jgi:hypothetical protein
LWLLEEETRIRYNLPRRVRKVRYRDSNSPSSSSSASTPVFVPRRAPSTQDLLARSIRFHQEQDRREARIREEHTREIILHEHEASVYGNSSKSRNTSQKSSIYMPSGHLRPPTSCIYGFSDISKPETGSAEANTKKARAIRPTSLSYRPQTAVAPQQDTEDNPSNSTLLPLDTLSPFSAKLAKHFRTPTAPRNSVIFSLHPPLNEKSPSHESFSNPNYLSSCSSTKQLLNSPDSGDSKTKWQGFWKPRNPVATINTRNETHDRLAGGNDVETTNVLNGAQSEQIFTILQEAELMREQSIDGDLPTEARAGVESPTKPRIVSQAYGSDTLAGKREGCVKPMTQFPRRTTNHPKLGPKERREEKSQRDQMYGKQKAMRENASAQSKSAKQNQSFQSTPVLSHIKPQKPPQPEHLAQAQEEETQTSLITPRGFSSILHKSRHLSSNTSLYAQKNKSTPNFARQPDRPVSTPQQPPSYSRSMPIITPDDSPIRTKFRNRSTRTVRPVKSRNGLPEVTESELRQMTPQSREFLRRQETLLRHLAGGTNEGAVSSSSNWYPPNDNQHAPSLRKVRSRSKSSGKSITWKPAAEGSIHSPQKRRMSKSEVTAHRPLPTPKSQPTLHVETHTSKPVRTSRFVEAEQTPVLGPGEHLDPFRDPLDGDASAKASAVQMGRLRLKPLSASMPNLLNTVANNPESKDVPGDGKVGAKAKKRWKKENWWKVWRLL